MQRSIERDLNSRNILPRSEIIELKHIGPYLYKRLIKEFAPNRQSLTIRRFATKIQNMSIDQLKFRLQKALQNKRNNQCIQSNGYMYHVPDFNTKGYEMMINLIKVLSRNENNFGFRHRFTFNARELRKPSTVSTSNLTCLSRRSCPRGRWRDGLCQPDNRAHGFPGVHPFSGQKTYARHENRQLGSSHNSIRRGRYAQGSGSVMWRRPGKMRKI